MGKQIWKPGNMLYPLPAVMVSVGDREGNANILTIAWTGTVCTNPPMVYISVRPERYSYHMIEESGEFVINLTTERLARATDYCGLLSGRDVDKWKETGLTADEMIYLGPCCTSPGFSTEVLHIYLALGLHRGKMHLDPDEFLNVEKYKLSELEKLVMSGEIDDAKTIIAVLKARRYLEDRK